MLQSLKKLVAKLGFTAEAPVDATTLNKTERQTVLAAAGAERLHAFLVDNGQPENEQKPYGTWTADELATMLAQQDGALTEMADKVDALIEQLMTEAAALPDEPTKATSKPATAAAPAKEQTPQQRMDAAVDLAHALEKRLKTPKLKNDARQVIEARLAQVAKRIRELEGQGAVAVSKRAKQGKPA